MQIPDSVTTIGESAFSDCTRLTNVVLSDSVTSIRGFTFYGCDSLTSIVLPDSVTTIGESAFADCAGLTSITIPDSVTGIGSMAFAGCVSLTGLQLPDSLSTIGDSAFAGCGGLDRITIPKSVTAIGNAAFMACSGLTEIHFDGKAPSFGGSDIFLAVTATAYYPANDATWANAVRQNYGGTITWTVQAPVKVIASGTCGQNLTWALDEDGKLTISGTGAMSDYRSDGVAPWYDHRNSIKSVVVESGVTGIGNYAFYKCTNLANVKISDSVTEIGDWAFYGCNSLTGITLPNSVAVIGAAAFSDCAYLSTIKLSDSLISIGSTAFAGCSSLASVVIPDSVSEIGEFAFYSCYALTDVTLGDSVATIGGNAFAECYELTGIIIPDSVVSIGEFAFSNCSCLEYVQIGNSVTSIGDSAFSCCYAMTSLTLGSSIANIGENAFSECVELTGITLPKSVANIGEYAFMACIGLTDITFEGSVPGYIGSEAFTAVTATAHYPAKDSSWTPSVLQDYGGTMTWVPYTVINALASGSCGQNLTWVLTKEGALTISGTGAMTNYSSGSRAPWYSYRASVLSVTIENGATSIGNYAFDGCTSMTAIELPNSMASIGDAAFGSCSALSGIALPDSLTTIGEWAFTGCNALTNLVIPGSVTTIGNGAFAVCSSLAKVEIGASVSDIGNSVFYDCSKLTQISFLGNAPVFGNDVFQNVTASAGYPANRTGWSEAVRQNYGGKITWESYCVGGHTVVIDRAVDATCTTDGKTEGKHCSACGQILAAQEVVPAKGHKHTAVVTAPTCTADGFTTFTCSCGDSYTANPVTKLGHDMGSWTTSKNPTCTVDGEQKRDCSRCDHFVTEKITAQGHKYTTVVTAPSCTADGYTTYTCSCGDTYTANPVTKLGHDMGSWTTSKKPSCTVDGEQRRDCSRCDYHETEVIKAQGQKHTAVVTAPTCTADGYTTYTCSCGDTYTANPVTKLGHDWGQWYEVTAATPDQDGQERRDCSRCDHYETQEVSYQGNVLKLPGEYFAEYSTVWIEGLPYAVQGQGDNRYVAAPELENFSIVTYTYHVGDGQDVHTQYPTGMKVYMVSDGQITYIPELDNLLQYSGSSIRIVGKKGIRMITSLTKENKKALTGDGLAGFKLLEYGTALCFASEIQEGDGLVLGREFTRSNFAYKKGEADPVFASPGNLIQYTNVLVGFTLDQCKEDIAMRPYIILEDGEGNQITLYGGTIYRSIGYIAYQNRSVFQPKTAAYDYVWELIHHVYGDQHDADFKG